MKYLLIVPVLLILTGCVSEKRSDDLPAVRPFDLQRYMGKWYEIARYPHSFEKGLSHVSATYSLQSDGRVQVLNRGIKGNGKEKIIKGVAVASHPAGSGELKVSFFRPFYGAYRIIYLSQNYDLSIVTSSTRAYLWILSRNPELTGSEKAFCLFWLKSREFDPEKLIWVDQAIK